jgi:hypothetical protein
MRVFLLFLFQLIALSVFSQGEEFKVHSNGLIYDEQTMSQLRAMVDSLNHSFENLPINKRHQSLPQAKVHYLEFHYGDFSKIREKLENNLEFERIIADHPKVKLMKNQLVIRFMDDDKRFIYQKLFLNGDYPLKISTIFPFYPFDSYKGKWVYKYNLECPHFLGQLC